MLLTERTEALLGSPIVFSIEQGTSGEANGGVGKEGEGESMSKTF